MDEDLLIGNKSWNRMSKALIQEGFREGAEAGKEETLQQGFNKGFNAGLANGIPLGELEGAMKVLAFQKVISTEGFPVSKVQAAKDCVICQDPDIELRGIPHIIKEQSVTSKAVLDSKLSSPAIEVLRKLQLSIPSDTSVSSSSTGEPSNKN